MAQEVSPIIGEPLASRLTEGALFDVVFELTIDFEATTIFAQYADLPERYAALTASIAQTMQGGTGETMRDPQDPVVAPYVFARLAGATIRTVVAANPIIVRSVRLDEAPKRSERPFDPAILIGNVIAEPLASKVRSAPNRCYAVIVDLDVRRGRIWARENVSISLEALRQRAPAAVGPSVENRESTHPYVFATLSGYAILALVDLDRNPITEHRSIYRVWEDSKVNALITESIATVKADAAHVAYSATGRSIVWAVLDSGVDRTHPHFAHFANLENVEPLEHRDFSGHPHGHPAAVEDAAGHGTHVAGIIAGSMSTSWPVRNADANAPAAAVAQPTEPIAMQRPVIVTTTRNEAGVEERQRSMPPAIAGMAPEAKIVSLRVLDDGGTGNVSAVINAIDQIQRWNDYGRRIVVHGVNMSLGYPFEAEWFACGQSPLCVEVDRLVQSGVVVVVAAGNSGYGYLQTEYTDSIAAGIGMSINDPGNAALAITVGATHRDSPHRYGVSYFSSKGPTGDGRLKPDLVAPGERIISCASSQSRAPLTVNEDKNGAPALIDADDYTYKEDSGTSMAAPHVSGIIAAFLSIRKEYIGRPLDVKATFVNAATDLGRDRAYQGAGLADLMRAIGSV